MSQWLPWLVGVTAVLLALAGGAGTKGRRDRGTPGGDGRRSARPPRPRGARPPGNTTPRRGTASTRDTASTRGTTTRGTTTGRGTATRGTTTGHGATSARGRTPTRGGTSTRDTTSNRRTAPATIPPQRRAPSRTPSSPRPGEIWWADVPYEDGTGSKVRPCLVLRTGAGAAEVLKITSQDKSNRTDHVRIPTSEWDPTAEHDSFLDLTDPIRVALSAFAERAGTCDGPLWREVRKLHGLRPGR